MAVSFEIIKITKAPKAGSLNPTQNMDTNIDGLKAELNRLGAIGYKFVAIIDEKYILLQKES